MLEIEEFEGDVKDKEDNNDEKDLLERARVN